MKPLFASEKLLAGPPYRGCGISSDFHGTMLATRNEAGQNKHARQMGKGQRRATLQRGWRAFATQKPADDNGWVDRNDIPRIHAAMFPKLPMPQLVRSAPDEAWGRIGAYALSIAIDTGAVGSGDAIRRYVGPVPHQVVAWKKKTVNGRREVKIIDPMHNQSELYTGHWVRWSSLVKCALAIKDANGRLFDIHYPVDGWTREASAVEDKNRTIRRVRDQRNAALKEAVDLQAQLTECREDKCDAAVEAVLDRYAELTDELRAAL